MQSSEGAAYRLWPREKQLLLFMADRPMPDKELAKLMNVSAGTIKVYLSHIRMKLTVQGFDVAYRYDLFEWARLHKEEL